MKSLFAALFAFALTASAFAAPLDPVLSGDNLWTQKPDEFMAAAKKLGFEWTSNAHDTARAAVRDMTGFYLPTTECLARFEGDALKQITVVLYARGRFRHLDGRQVRWLGARRCGRLERRQ